MSAFRPTSSPDPHSPTSTPFQRQKSFLVSAPQPEHFRLLHEHLLVRAGNDFSYEPRQAGPAEVFMRKTVLRKMVTCFPENQNMYGKVFGGFLMRMAFELAAASSKLFAGTRTECVAMDDYMFHEGVEIGDMVEFTTKIIYTEDHFIQAGAPVLCLPVGPLGGHVLGR